MSDLSVLPLRALHVQTLLDALAVPAALYGPGGFATANEALCRLSGRALTELQTLPIGAIVVADDRRPLQELAQSCLHDGRPMPALQCRLLTGSGSERQVEMHLRPFEHDGAPALLLTCIDQSDILHVQTSLFALSGMLRQIIDGAPIASLVIDAEHRVTHWNGACERMTGVARQQVIGTREAWRAFYEHERPLLADLLVDGVDIKTILGHYHGSTWVSADIPGGIEAEAFFRRFGGSGHWLYFTAAPLRDAEGKVIGAVETLQNVTERHRAQEELLRHRFELEQLVQQRSAELAATARELERFVANATQGVAYSAAGVIQKVNRAMADLFGYTQARMQGMPGPQVCLNAEDYAELGRLAGIVLPHGEPLRHEMWMRHADGHPIWVQIDAHVADPDDPGVGTWWMLQDRTEIRAAQQQLQARFEELRETNRKLEEAQNKLLQQDRMASIGQLAAGVAHEINNPVGFVGSNFNTLRQYVESLLALVGAGDELAAAPQDAGAAARLARLREEVELDYLREDLPQLLDECADGLGRVKKIVQDLKDFSRVDQSDWHEADLNAGLESTLNVVRHEVKYRADVVKRLAPLPPVTCLAAQLNQVFMNLIVNAAQALGDHGTITLSTGTQEGWAWVQVDDTGCGMSDEVRRRIFEPFYTTKEVGKGTGLGLSLSFSIVQRHHGTIQVRSAPGVGSSFRVWVPIDGPQAVAQDAPAPEWPEAAAI